MNFFRLCPCGTSCLEIIDDKCFYTATGREVLLTGTTPEDVFSAYTALCLEDSIYISTEDRLSIQAALREHFERLATKELVDSVVQEYKDRLDKRKLYILIREDISVGHSINCAAHAAAKAVREWSGDEDFELWYNNSFRKVTCKVSRGTFEEAKKIKDHIIISEDVLNDTEVAIIFKPRECWPEFFRRLRLYS